MKIEDIGDLKCPPSSFLSLTSLPTGYSLNFLTIDALLLIAKLISI